MAIHLGGSASAFIGQRPGLASVSVLLRQSSRTNSELPAEQDFSWPRLFRRGTKRASQPPRSCFAGAMIPETAHERGVPA